MKTGAITQTRLKELLSYDAMTGQFVWTGNDQKGGKRVPGLIAGSKHRTGYIHIQIDWVIYKAHRLAWLFVHGDIDHSLQIDHINSNRADNRIENLRLASRSINMQNRRSAQRNNKSGRLGVSPHHGVFCAAICADGKQKHLGTFQSSADAHQAYLKAKRELHEGCTI